MVATIQRRAPRRQSDAVTPKEFCRALWEQRRTLAEPTTPLGVRTLQLGILLTHFIRANPTSGAFEVALEEIAHDENPRREMLRLSARQVLRLWRARRWLRAGDGHLTVIDRPRHAAS